MKKLSRFDLGFIIAFAVVTLLGGGVSYYYWQELQAAQLAVTSAKSNFDKYSTKYHVVVSRSNGKALQANIDLLRAQLGPLIHTQLQPKENKLRSIEKEDPVAWKHDLEDEINRLDTAAKIRGVTLPPNFYFGFSRYQSQPPNDVQTAVLSKQLVGVEQLATILINAPVKGIQAIRRSYEEDPHAAGASAPSAQLDPDQLAGYALTATANAYTAYPFEVDFETTPENLRPVIKHLIQSAPYLFVVRTLVIENSNPNSYLMSDLDKLAGPPPAPVTDTSPGEVAATTSTKGPQFLFGNASLKVRARIDLIEWDAEVSEK